MRVHGTSVGEILVHPLHQLGEAAKGHDLWDTRQQSRKGILVRTLQFIQIKFNDPHNPMEIASGNNVTRARQAAILVSLTVIQDNQQGSQEVAHALDVTRVQMLPHITAKTKIFW